jgi:hypothetical protein
MRVSLPVLAHRGRRGKRQRWRLPPLFRTVLVVCLFVPLAVSFLLALEPVHQSDAIRYHMAVPALYIWNGGYLELPHSAFSNFPFTVEMLYTGGLLFGAESAAKLIHWSFFVLLIGGVYLLGTHVRRRNLGLLSAAVLANVPFIPIFASWAFIEVALALYQFLVFYCLIRFLRCLRDEEPWGEEVWPPAPSKQHRFLLRPSGWMVLCGIFSGFGLGTKYTSLIPFGLAVLTVAGYAAFNRVRSRPDKEATKEQRSKEIWRTLPSPLRHAALLIVPAVLIACPWYLKNTLELGNPVYPFAGSVFPTPHWTQYNEAFYKYHAGLKGELNRFHDKDAVGKVWDVLTLPYTLTVGRRIEDDVVYLSTCRLSRLCPWIREDGVPGGIYPFLVSGEGGKERREADSIYFGGWEVGLLWILLLPLLLTVRKIPFEVKALLGYGLFLFLFWSLTYRDNRFLIPVFAVLAVPAGFALLAYTQKAWSTFAKFRLFFALILLMNLMWFLRTVFTDNNPFPIITGRQSIVSFLEDQRDTGGFIRAVVEANKVRDHGEKILLVGEYRAYHCKPPYAASDWFNTPVLIDWIRESGSLQALVERLREEKIKYVLINQGEIDKYFPYYFPHFMPVDTAAEYMRRYRLAQTREERNQIIDRVLGFIFKSSVWRIYRDFTMSEELLEPVYEEPFDNPELRPPMPARSRIGVYRVVYPGEEPDAKTPGGE